MSHLQQLWIAVLNMSASASYVALGVIVVRFLLARMGAPKIFAYALWTAVLIRLVVPFSFTASFSLLGLAPSEPAQGGATLRTMNYVPDAFNPAATPAANAGRSSLDGVAAGLQPPPEAGAAINRPQRVMVILSRVWLCGVVGLLLYGLTSYLAILRKVRTATRLRDNIWETDRIDAPFVCGFLHPRIHVPLGLTADQLIYIEAHEQTHIRRFDHFVKPFAFAVLAIHWFNPLMWVAYKLMSRDMELSCDEQAIRTLGMPARVGYSRALLELSERRSGLPVGSLPAFGENSVRARIQHVLHYRYARRSIVIMAVILTVCVFVACLANPEPKNTAESKAAQTERLFANRTRYIGDNSKDIALLRALEWPIGAQFRKLQLQTSRAPYGMTVTFRVSDDYLAVVPQLQDANWKANAILLLSLIDNAETIDFVMDFPRGSERLSFTRTEANALLETDVRAFARDLDTFSAFRQRVNQLLGSSPVKLDVPTVGSGGWIQPAPTVANWGGDPAELLAVRDGYTNALSANIAFVVALSWPHGARRGQLALDNGAGMIYGAPATFYGIKDGEKRGKIPIGKGDHPPGLNVLFSMADEDSLPASGVQDAAWKANAILLFSLNEDIDTVTFFVICPLPGQAPRKGCGGPPVLLRYTRAEADAAIGRDVRTFASDPVRFRDLMKRLAQI
jgi:beta-lactamase regulating signal transducer with metallopeptidase domain